MPIQNPVVLPNLQNETDRHEQQKPDLVEWVDRNGFLYFVVLGDAPQKFRIR